ncbi:MAG: cob(I)yrinic acid a,c-diamide adenosyltransferase [Lachnospiraceae bacterium]|nr:cob(I)yrinic acid a,c-diamide adenosyltransferase [Lachnospiraceae bacterium]
MTFFKRDTKTDDHGRKKAGRLPRVIAGLIAACVLAVTALPGVVPGSIALADEPYTAGNSLPGIEGGAGYMMEANTGVCLYSYNGDQRMNPASTTKILTALLVIEHCTDYQEVITFSHDSVNNISWDSSKIGALEYDMVVLDEINCAMYFGLIDVSEVLELIKHKPVHTELILTGRCAPDEIIEAADLVTEMREIKHYYNEGVQARKGIEN